MGTDDARHDRALTAHDADDIEVVSDIEVVQDPPPPTAPPPAVPPPAVAGTERAWRWHLRWILPLGAVLFGVAVFGFWTIRSATDGMKATTDQFMNTVNYDAVDALLDGGPNCLSGANYPDRRDGDARSDGVVWTFVDTGYHLEIGSGSLTFTWSNLNDEAAEPLLELLREDRPADTDFGVVVARHDQGLEPAEVRFLLVRQPGLDWRICAVDVTATA